jgi:hypothetical protein
MATPFKRVSTAVILVAVVFGLAPTGSANAATQSLVVTASPASPTAGTPFSITVRAVDASGQTDPTYTGTVHFATGDTSPDVVMPADSQLTDGEGTFSATLIRAGPYPSVTVSDASNLLSTTLHLTVMPAAPERFALGLRTGATASYGFSFVMSVLDRYDNIVGSYDGTVHFTTSDTSPGVKLPPDSRLPNGKWMFGATLDNAGPQTVTATDTMTSSITGTLYVTIRPGPAAGIRLDVPATATMGQSFDVTLTLLDRVGNVATGASVPYTGTIYFASSDQLATLPADYTFQQSYYAADSGIRTFTATLMTPGDQTITATDTANASITGTSPSISVVLPLLGVGTARP